MVSIGFDSLQIPAKLANTSTCPNVFTTDLKALSISSRRRTSTLWNKIDLLGNSNFNSAIAALGSQISNIATFYTKETLLYIDFFFS